MPKQEKEKICFVIAPIGDEGSEIRRRSDQVLKHIIAPAAKDCGYETIRADKISEPGIITSQVIQHLVDDALVIADLTGRNPNVFYELAIRHAVRKPVVQIIHTGESIPFDVAASRTIHVDHHDLDSVARCRDELSQQIRSVERDPSQVDTPISVAIDLQSLRQSDNPLEKSNAEIITMLQELRSMVGESRRFRMHPGMVEELFMLYDRLLEILELPEGEDPTRSNFEEAAHTLHKFSRMMEMLAMESGMPPRMFEDLMERRLGRKRRIK
jgi:hypothetical protein